jgi:hypothetical protein
MTNSIIRDQELAYNRCIKDITVVGPTITVNAEWEQVGTLNGTALYYQIAPVPAAPVTVLPAATGTYVGCEVDIEKKILCEVISPTVTNTFMRVKVYDSGTSNVLVTRDFELDEVTAYVVTDENDVTVCGSETNLTLTPNHNVATNGAPVVLPAGVRSFTVTNLGLNGSGLVFSDITTAGISSSTTIPALVATATWSAEEDQDGLGAGTITITPAAGHQAYVQWVA